MPPKVATPHAKLYRELAEKELELKDLEKQHEALVELQRQLPLMRNRLQGFQKARASREEAVRSLIEERQAELLEVNHEIQVLEAIAEASERIYPDLKTAQPLGESLHLAVEDMKNLHSSKPKGLSMRQPASWPSTFILADLMLACSEISATDAFISSTPFQGVDRMRLDAPGRDNELLNDTRLTVDRLVTRSSPSRRQELQREHEELRRDLEASTRSLEDRLRLVLDCQGPLHRALCIQELRHCELAVLMCRRLETLAEEEANWSMEYKSALMSEGRDMRKVKLKSETIVLRNRLHKLCFNSTGGRSLKEDMAWGALHARDIFTVTSARKEVECLRQKVAAATLAMHRATHPKLDAINSECHAILKTVKEQVQEAQRILEEFATWASRVESSLVLFATSKPSWCALAAAEPSAMIEEAARLRQVFNKIIQATKKKVPVPSKEAGPKRRPKSASQATNSGSKEEEEGRRGSF